MARNTVLERLRVQAKEGLMGVPDDFQIVSYGEAADRISALEYALLEIIGTADEYKAMPCDSLESRFFSTVERYRSVIEK